ncbi:MAG: hypothetical protein MJY80_04125 [Bacteroidales bacterium]|nr:hypothetical protein [Bacteroidales bacterium]
MKRILLLLATIPIFFGCEKMQPSGNNGIYVNDKLECELKSAFVGGGTADPDEGHSSRMHIYEDYYSAGPSWKEVKERVWIYGFYHNGKEYSSADEFIDGIVLNGLSSIGNIKIPMNQGKYEGGNEQVSSVSIVKYSLGKYDDKGVCQKEDSQININITLKDNQTISIIYSGLTPYDGYY